MRVSARATCALFLVCLNWPAAAQGGYEFVGATGFFFRICPVGLGYTPSAAIAREHRLMWAGSVGLGWKLW